MGQTTNSLREFGEYSPSILTDIFEPDYKQCSRCTYVKSIYHFDKTVRMCLHCLDQIEDEKSDEEFYKKAETNEEYRKFIEEEEKFLLELSLKTSLEPKPDPYIKLCIGCGETKPISEFDEQRAPIASFWTQVIGTVGLREQVTAKWGICCKECETNVPVDKECQHCKQTQPAGEFPIYSPERICLINICWVCYKANYLDGVPQYKFPLIPY